MLGGSYWVIVVTSCVTFSECEIISTTVIDEYRNHVIICTANKTCTINCQTEGGCRNSTINCPDSNNCQVLCNATRSCYDTTINCPATNGSASCQLTAISVDTNDYTAAYSIFNANYTNNPIINCYGRTSCLATKIYNCHGASSPHGTMIINARGSVESIYSYESYSLHSAKIYGSQTGGDLIIDATTGYGLAFADVFAFNSNNVFINCGFNDSNINAVGRTIACWHINIYANSIRGNLTMYSNYEGMEMSKVYCPTNYDVDSDSWDKNDSYPKCNFYSVNPNATNNPATWWRGLNMTVFAILGLNNDFTINCIGDIPVIYNSFLDVYINCFTYSQIKCQIDYSSVCEYSVLDGNSQVATCLNGSHVKKNSLIDFSCIDFQLSVATSTAPATSITATTMKTSIATKATTTIRSGAATATSTAEMATSLTPEITNITTLLIANTTTTGPLTVSSTREPMATLTGVPRKTPSMNMTTITTTGSPLQSTAELSNIGQSQIELELIPIYVFGFVIVFLCVVKLLYVMVTKHAEVQLTYDFLSLFRLTHRIFDLLTDVLVCYSIYLSNDNKFDEYVYASITFILLPFIVSILITMYHVYFKWNKKINKNMSQNFANHERITNYLKKYKYVLVIIALICCDFYCAINLAESKLFCLQMFNLQLKLSEKESLVVWKFINSTLCENIPQIIVQLLYLRKVNNQNHEESLLITISLLFSIISILSQTVLFLVGLNNILIEYNSHVTQITTFESKMTLYSPYFKSQHQFIHDQIQRILRNSFLKSGRISELLNRGDIKLKHCVYYIDNLNLNAKHTIDVYFEVNVACYNDINYTIRDEIGLKLNELGDSSSSLYKDTIHGATILLKLKQLRIIEKEFEILSQETIDKNYNNATLLRLSMWRGAIATKIELMSPQFITDKTAKELMEFQLPPKPMINQSVFTNPTTEGGDVEVNQLVDNCEDDIEVILTNMGTDDMEQHGSGECKNVSKENVDCTDHDLEKTNNNALLDELQIEGEQHTIDSKI